MLLLESCLQTCMTYTIAECTVNKLLMMDRRTLRNMKSFMTKLICKISASIWFYYKEIWLISFLLIPRFACRRLSTNLYDIYHC